MLVENNPTVCIVTPTYNHERFIGQCIESVLAQTYSNWEQIIIDDGSTDRTPEVVRCYSDSRIKYISQENQGIEALAHNYNRALKESKGELIGILEGDDLWPPNKLETLVPHFQDRGVVLAYGIPKEIDVNGIVSRNLPKQVREKLDLPQSVLFNDPVGTATRFMLHADGYELIAPSTVIIRRDALRGIGGFQYFPNLCTTDYPTFVRISRYGRFHFQREIMGFRRRHVESGVFRYLAEMSEALPKLVRSLLDEFRPIISAAECEKIERSLEGLRYLKCFTQGRLDLLREDWRSARRHFSQAIGRSHPRVAVASIIGWICSWLRCNIEPMFKLAGRSHLESSPVVKNAEIPRR